MTFGHRLSGGLRRLAGLFGLRVCAMGLTFLQTIAMTQVFGSAVFGQLSFAMSVGAILVLIASVGFDQILMRDLARVGVANASGSGEWRAVLNFSARFVTVFTLAACAAVLAALALTDVFAEYRPAVFLVVALAPLVVLRKFLDALLLGAKRVAHSLISTQIAYPLLIILGVLAVVLLGLDRSLGTLMGVYGMATVISTLLGALLCMAVIARIMPRQDVRSAPLERRGLMISSFHFALVSLGFVVGQNIDVLLMGVLSTPENVAIVRVSARVAEIIAVVRSVAIVQYRPEIAEAFGRGETERLQQIALRLVRIYVVTGLPLYVLGMVFAGPLLHLFGADFAGGEWALRGYLTGVFFAMLCGPSATILALCGHEAAAARALWFGLAANVGLDLILIPRLGASGAALANMVSLCIMGVWSATATYRILGIRSSALSLLRPGLFRRSQ